MRLSAALGSPDGITHLFKNHERLFSEIRLVTDIIDSSADESLGGDTIRFTLEGCVLGPLFFVAVRFRHEILRRKVTSLVEFSRRLESCGIAISWHKSRRRSWRSRRGNGISL